MNSLQIFNERVDKLITLADKTLLTKVDPQSYASTASVQSELFIELRTSSLSFIKNLYGDQHIYYTDFIARFIYAQPSHVTGARGILKAIKSEIENGWLTSLQGIVSAEIFFDFLEMAEHLLSEKYKDPAAVMIGSVLEEHLRQLCNKNVIVTSETKGNKNFPKKS